MEIAELYNATAMFELRRQELVELDSGTSVFAENVHKSSNNIIILSVLSSKDEYNIQ